MRLYAPVTLYHYNSEKDDYDTFFFPKAKVHGINKIGDLTHSRRALNQVTVRIFTTDEIEASCGDKIYSDVFLKELTVVGVSDNRRGSKKVHHYKLIVR